jgi:hypothetical protein
MFDLQPLRHTSTLPTPAVQSLSRERRVSGANPMSGRPVRTAGSGGKPFSPTAGRAARERRQQPLCSQVDPGMAIHATPSPAHGAVPWRLSDRRRNSKDSDFRAVLATIQKCGRKQKVELLCWHFRGEGHAMDDLEQLVCCARWRSAHRSLTLTSTPIYRATVGKTSAASYLCLMLRDAA